MTTIIVFAFSLFVVLILVLLKAIELKYGKKNILLKLIYKLEPSSIKLVAFLKFKSLQLIQSVRYIVLVEMKEMITYFFDQTHDKIMNEYKKRQEVILVGKKNIINKGSVSFYLKKITEDKGSNERGKIEEIL
ncbi:MAG: hypothetical protein WC657_02885 [Candidatus Paceibacterota bacterium]|jgi:hypothetical protein